MESMVWKRELGLYVFENMCVGSVVLRVVGWKECSGSPCDQQGGWEESEDMWLEGGECCDSLELVC